MNAITRVLIVDDKEENLYYLRALFSGHGMEVDEARHGAEALVKARMQQPSIIVSDLLMPVMDGYTLLRYWKADPLLKKIPFIVYTATYTEAEDEKLALDLGADAFILKPAEPDDFLLRIREVNTRSIEQAPAKPLSEPTDEKEILKVYSETLIRKLEEKMMLLEQANQALEKDIAERKAAEAKLQEQAELLDKAQDAIVVRDLEHRVLYWNKGAESLYGWKADEVIGRSIEKLLTKDHEAYQLALEATLNQGEWMGELDEVTKAGETRSVEARWTLVRDDRGQPKSILSIKTDITQRKKLEEQFLRAQRMESIGTLAGGIAHDLNNVLAPIMMAVELLKLEEKSPARINMLDMIESSARRGASMVSQVLTFARGLEGRRVEVQVRHLIREMVKIAAGSFPKNITINSQVAADLWTLKADPTQLHQVLLNLCVNARDAMPDGGSIKITAENVMLDEQYAAMNIEASTGPYVHVEVADTGGGIPQKVIEKIFDPFFTTKEVGKGTGLGLSTVMAIVKSHGGFIRVQSEMGMGAKFHIYLPAQTTTCSTASQEEASEPPKGKGETVLIVDDEDSIRQIAKRTLETFGYKVLQAGNGSEALDLYEARQQEIAVIITDMMMPVMDGQATIQALRQMNPKIRIIGTTGMMTSSRVSQITSLGIQYLLPKPFTAETLLNTVRKVLDAP